MVVIGLGKNLLLKSVLGHVGNRSFEQNSWKHVTGSLKDLDLILHPQESDEYTRRRGYVGSKFETKVVDFNSLFDENGDIEDGGNQKVVDQQEDEGLAADEAEEDEVIF